MSFFSWATSCQAMPRESHSLPGCLFLSFSDWPTSHHCSADCNKEGLLDAGTCAAAAADADSCTCKLHLRLGRLRSWCWCGKAGNPGLEEPRSQVPL
jgi:hypothetical protein